MKIYTENEMNAAIERVEAVKKEHPTGWRFLRDLNLPEEDLIIYTWANADAHVERLGNEEDRRVIYSAGWLNGIGIGVALGEQRAEH